MGIHTAWLALFSAEGDDPVAWTMLRDITSLDPPTRHFPSREFPPEGLLPPDQPFCLALFPLTGPRGQLGYVAFDTEHLDLYGAITQELATALNSAQLYREATEGRRLAEEANELKSRFLSTVSHELRTPLNLIVGLSGILLQENDESDTPLPEPYRRDVEQIYANAQHLGGLIGDVLDLASSDAGQLRLANEFVDLGRGPCLVAETGRRLAYERGLAWQADLPACGPWVWGDRTRLRQVVLNLVNNAIKFTAHGQVRLEVKADPDWVTVAVHDTGLGIPPEEQEAVFDEFRRSERASGAVMAAWAWGWRFADGSSNCTVGPLACSPQARRAPARPSGSPCRQCNRPPARISFLSPRLPKRAFGAEPPCRERPTTARIPGRARLWRADRVHR
jgi:hypothetical protein